MTEPITFTGIHPETHLRASGPDAPARIAVLAHMLGRATPEQVRYLEEDPEDWRRMLVQYKAHVSSQLTAMLSASTSVKERCHREGHRGKRAWLAYRTLWLTHRALVVDYANACERALAIVNQIRREDAEDAASAAVEPVAALTERVATLEMQLFALAARVHELEHAPVPVFAELR